MHTSYIFRKFYFKERSLSQLTDSFIINRAPSEEISTLKESNLSFGIQLSFHSRPCLTRQIGKNCLSCKYIQYISYPTVSEVQQTRAREFKDVDEGTYLEDPCQDNKPVQ